MPALNALGKQYAKKDVIVLSVNVGDEKSEYQKFIKESGYSHLHWARDSSGDIVEMYKVSAIPATYLLDRESIIRYAHLGFSSRMQDTFTDEIESLLE